jgi:integrase
MTDQSNKRERGRGRIFARTGSSSLWCAYYLRGKEYRESTGETDHAKAEKYLRHRLKETGADQLGLKKFVGPAQQRITVGKILEALTARFTINGQNNTRYRSNLLPIMEWFGDYRATELTSTDIDQFIAYAQQHGRRKNPPKPKGRHAGRPCADRPAKPGSINRSTQLLGQAYKLAIENGILNTAPKIQKLSEVGNARQGFFGAMEFRSVLSNLSEHLRDFCLFAYLTGWRVGEVRSLSWTDLDGDSLKLRAENSKNRTARNVPLVGELAELIERRRLQMSTETSLIFHHKGQRIGDFRRAWTTACKLAGCPGRLVHDLRRTGVRDMIRAGVPQSVAMSISGHKTNHMFLRYNITSDQDQRTALLNRQSYNAQQIAAEPDKQKPTQLTERVQ